MPQYPLPPWLSRPADPAAHYVTGLQIEMKMGQEQAQAELSQQMLERQKTRDAVDQQLKQQAAGLRTQEAAQSYQAQQRYQKRMQELVAAGLDPQQAGRQSLLENGPAMGFTGPAMGALARPAAVPAPHVLRPGENLIDPRTGKTLAAIPAAAAEQWQRTTEGGMSGQKSTKTGLFRPDPRQPDESRIEMDKRLTEIDREMLSLEKDGQFPIWSGGPETWSNKLDPSNRKQFEKKFAAYQELQTEHAQLQNRRKAIIMGQPNAGTPTQAAPPSGPTRLIYDPKAGKIVNPQAGQPTGAAPTPAAPPPAAAPAPRVAPQVIGTSPASLGARAGVAAGLMGREALGERALQTAGKALRSKPGRVLADIYEGTAGLTDVATIGLFDLNKRLKKLEEEILKATE